MAVSIFLFNSPLTLPIMMTYFKFKIALSLAHEGRPYALLFDDTPRARDWQNSQDQKSTAFLLLVKSAHTAIDAALTDEMQTVEELVNDSVEPRVRLSRIKEFINDKVRQIAKGIERIVGVADFQAMTTENEVKKEADPPAAPKQTVSMQRRFKAGRLALRVTPGSPSSADRLKRLLRARA